MPWRSTEISVVGSMLPPETTAQTGPVPPALPDEQRGDADRAGALDEQLRALEQERDRVADLVVVDDDEVVEQPAEDLHRQLARAA